MSTELTAAIAELRLVDHHVHTTLREQPTAAEFDQLLTESDRPPAPDTIHLDSQVGLALRRHCAPVLGLERHASLAEYLEVRLSLDSTEVDRLLLGASGVDHWLVDTGYQGDQVRTLTDFAGLVPSARVREIVRLESVLEAVAPGGDAAGLPERFREALAEATLGAAGVKSIIAYRHGFTFDPARPDDNEVRGAAARWLRELDSGMAPRVTDPVLLRFLLWEGASLGLPVQLHVGYGDPDLELHRCNPLLLTSWLRAVAPVVPAVMLLHCYPYHRQAGYLAQVFPHVYFDVGLAVNYAGAASDRVIAEALELAPFSKILYSSDAWGPAELHYLGSVLWRRGLSKALMGWVEEGEWSVDDALAVATRIGRENALRVYGGAA